MDVEAYSANGQNIEFQQYEVSAILNSETYFLNQKYLDYQFLSNILCCNRNIGNFAERHRVFSNIVYKLSGVKTPYFSAAVTGTNGKSSTVSFASALWKQYGEKSASIGTLGLYEDGNFIATLPLTTPDARTMSQVLKFLEQKGTNFIALEAASHGLVQRRLSGLKFSCGAFTNVTHDHIDYHGSFDEYLAAKNLLFSELLPVGAYAVLNADSEFYGNQVKIAHSRKLITLDYSCSHTNAVIFAQEVKKTNSGFEIAVSVDGKIIRGELNALGQFQIENLMCALGIIQASGVNVKDFANLYAPSGRMEIVADNVVIDYAHTPDSLYKALLAVKYHGWERIVVVFGCGGDRDQEKRPQMGKIAASIADFVIVTDDNPRNEEPAEIRQQIISGCERNVLEEGDRLKAIQLGVDLARQHKAVLLIAGKGHEKFSICGDTKKFFSDADAVRQILVSRSGLQ